VGMGPSVKVFIQESTLTKLSYDLLISSNSSKPPSLNLTQNLRPLHLTTLTIKEHRRNSLYAMNRLVLVLLAQHARGP
jgi:hypothetical protein